MKSIIFLALFSLLGINGNCQGAFINCSDMLPGDRGLVTDPTLISDNNGNLYIYFADYFYGLWKFNDDRTEIIDMKIDDSFPEYAGLFEKVTIEDVAVDKDGILHISCYLTKYSSCRLKYDGKEFYDIKLSDKSLNKIALDNNDNEWFISVFGIVKYNGLSFQEYPYTFQGNHSGDICIDKNGNPVLAVLDANGNKGLQIFENGVWIPKFVNEEIKLLFPWVVSLETDKNGNIWVLGEASAAKYDGEKWTIERQYLQDVDYYLYTTFLCMIQDKNGYYWFGNRIGVSGYDGFNWTNDYSLTRRADSIALDGNILWAANANELWRRNLSTDSIKEEIKPQPISISIYPNPFNPNTTINFSIEQEGFTDLTIYNILGIPVKNLIRSDIHLGKYSIKWNGRDENGKEVSSGIYFISLKNVSGCITKKMLKIR